MNRKIIVLCYNYEPSQFPKNPDNENRFFTYGFGSTFGKMFSHYLKDYEVEVWRMDGFCNINYAEKKIDNVRYRVFKAINFFRIGYYSGNFFKKLKAEYKKNNPFFFITHTHNWQTYQIAGRLKGAKIITTHHGDWSPYFLYNSTSGVKKIKALIGMIAEKKTFKNISYFLICDHKQVNYIEKAAGKINYEIFATGLDIKKFIEVPKNSAREELGLDINKKYILYVGKLYKYKQVDLLIKIWQKVKKVIPETELLLAGNESPDKWGEEYYELAVNSGAKVIGRILNNELYKYYCASDVYVLISLRDDYFGGTGIAPLESLACNTPVVSNSFKNYLGDNASEICEIPEDEESYYISIIKVLTEPGKYKNMRNSVEKYYSQEAVAKRIGIVFDKLIDYNI